MKLTAQVFRDEDGGFYAEIEEIPGTITQGDTFEELEANVQEVIEMSLEGLIQDYVDSIEGPPIEVEHGAFAWTFELTPQRVKSKAKA
jgi:predicted RNase H-like HicB family nuclease